MYSGRGVRVIATLSLVLSLTAGGLGFVTPIDVSGGHRGFVPYDIAAIAIGPSGLAPETTKLRNKARARTSLASNPDPVGILGLFRTPATLDSSREVARSRGERVSCLAVAVALVRGPPHVA